MRIKTAKRAIAAVTLAAGLAGGGLALAALDGHPATAVRQSVQADQGTATATSTATASAGVTATSDSNDPWD
jgi:hypothetical protein